METDTYYLLRRRPQARSAAARPSPVRQQRPVGTDAAAVQSEGRRGTNVDQHGDGTERVVKVRVYFEVIG